MFSEYTFLDEIITKTLTWLEVECKYWSPEGIRVFFLQLKRFFYFYVIYNLLNFESLKMT
jgi:hypothetical protein